MGTRAATPRAGSAPGSLAADSSSWQTDLFKRGRSRRKVAVYTVLEAWRPQTAPDASLPESPPRRAPRKQGAQAALPQTPGLRETASPGHMPEPSPRELPARGRMRTVSLQRFTPTGDSFPFRALFTARGVLSTEDSQKQQKHFVTRCREAGRQRGGPGCRAAWLYLEVTRSVLSSSYPTASPSASNSCDPLWTRQPPFVW